MTGLFSYIWPGAKGIENRYGDRP